MNPVSFQQGGAGAVISQSVCCCNGIFLPKLRSVTRTRNHACAMSRPLEHAVRPGEFGDIARQFISQRSFRFDQMGQWELLI